MPRRKIQKEWVGAAKAAFAFLTDSRNREPKGKKHTKKQPQLLSPHMPERLCLPDSIKRKPN